MTATRQAQVPPERLAGWVDRFVGSHGPSVPSLDGTADPPARLLSAEDGSWARLRAWSPPPADDLASSGAGLGRALGEWARPPALLVILVRRGGYAVAVVSGAGELVAHKVGTRLVQSRTAAGGWSQQRYARRRENQADALVEAVIGHAARVLSEGQSRAGPVGGVVLGGDRTLASAVLEALPSASPASASLPALTGLPRRGLWNLPDPRRAVLDDAVATARAVQIEVHNA